MEFKNQESGESFMFLSIHLYKLKIVTQSKLTNTLNIHFQNGGFIKKKLCVPRHPYTLIKITFHSFVYTEDNIHQASSSYQTKEILITNIIYTWRQIHGRLVRFLWHRRAPNETHSTRTEALKAGFDFQMSAHVKGLLKSEIFPVKFPGLSRKCVSLAAAVSPEVPVWSGWGCWWWTGCAAGRDTGRTRWTGTSQRPRHRTPSCWSPSERDAPGPAGTDSECNSVQIWDTYTSLESFLFILSTSTSTFNRQL